MHHPTDRISHTTAFVTPVVEHWLEWEIAFDIVMRSLPFVFTESRDIHILARFTSELDVLYILQYQMLMENKPTLNAKQKHISCDTIS